MDFEKGVMQELSPGIYSFILPPAQGSHGGLARSNAGLIVGEEYAVVVDTFATGSWTADFLSEIKRVTDRPVRYILQTHAHSDHMFGHHLFPGAIIICHTVCGAAARRMAGDPAHEFALRKRLHPWMDFGDAQITPPAITFDSQLVIWQGNREIRAIHPGPAHTRGDIYVHLPSDGVLLAGDVLSFLITPLSVSADFPHWIRVLDDLAALNARVYVPGHGPVCGKDGVLECKGYLESVYKQAQDKFAAGVPAREAALSIDLGRFKSWANPEHVLGNVERMYRQFDGGEMHSEAEAVRLTLDMLELGRTGW